VRLAGDLGDPAGVLIRYGEWVEPVMLVALQLVHRHRRRGSPRAFEAATLKPVSS
jgi:hypothetical protein